MSSRWEPKPTQVLPPGVRWVPVADITGPPGAAAPGALSFEHVQDTPSLSWLINVPPTFTRRPTVTVYSDEREVLADVTWDPQNRRIQIDWLTPTPGVAVLR